MTINIYKICRISFVALQFFVLTISSSAITDEYGPNTFSQKPFTAIVVAYEPEMRGLLEAIETDPNAQILDEYNFKGIKYRTLNPTEEYLEFCYGDWKTGKRTSNKEVYSNSNHLRKFTAKNKLKIFFQKIIKKILN